MKNIVSDHLARGHVIVITSAAFTCSGARTALGITEILCNQCEVDTPGPHRRSVKPILRGRSKAKLSSPTPPP